MLFISFNLLSEIKVTVLSTFPASPADNLPNYHHIYIKIEDSDGWSRLRKEVVNESKTPENQFKQIPKQVHMINHRSSEVMKHEIVRNLLKSEQKFDLFVLGFNVHDPLLGLAGHYRVPSVVLSTIPTLMKCLRDYIGNPAHISSAPVYAPPEAVFRMGFRERWSLFVEYVFEYTLVTYMNYFIFNPFYDEYFPAAKNYPSFDDVKKNVSLILINTHFSEGRIRPLLPNLIEVSGIHLKEKPNALPKVRSHSTIADFFPKI